MRIKIDLNALKSTRNVETFSSKYFLMGHLNGK